jgi:hypothetical protein
MMRRVRPLKGVVMSGSFTSGRYRFQVEASDETSDKERGFDEELEDSEFDLRLSNTGHIPDLGGAPIASWLLARLERLVGPVVAGKEYNDGGGYLVEFVAYEVYVEPEKPKGAFVQPLLFDTDALGIHIEPDKPVASFQFQADMQGAAVLGYRAVDCPGEDVLKALAAAFLAAPEDLVPCKVAVIDPEWREDPEMYKPRPFKGSRNWYGWDGRKFLGQDNTRDADLWL